MPPSEAFSQLHSFTLPRELCVELWGRIIARLEQGESFTSNRNFQAALEEEYLEATGTGPSAETRGYIQQMVATVNSLYPNTYLSQGMQNGVTRAFEEGARKLRWDTTKIQAKGAAAIRRFSRQDTVRDALSEANVRLDRNALLNVVTRAIETIEKEERGREALAAPTAGQGASPLAQLTPPAAPSATAPPAMSASAAAATPAAPLDDPEIQEAIQDGDLSQEEVDQRVQEQEQRRGELEQQEREKLPQNLPRYVERGLITQEEADKAEVLHEIDEQVRKGELSEKEASRIRNSYMDGNARQELDEKIRAAMSGPVRYLQVFDSMKRVSSRYDGAMTLLIQHKKLVVARENDKIDLAPLLEALKEDGDIFDDIAAIMDRRDQEIRLMAIRLPPYSHIMKRGLERLGNLTIEPGFVDELRSLTLDEMSERMNSADSQVRARPAADIRCFINLIDHVTKRTRVRKEIRMLKILRTLEEFFESTADTGEARNQAETFLRMRASRLFPDLSSDELQEIRERGPKIIDALEEKAREGAPKRHRADEPDKKQVFRADEMEMTPEEAEKGVQVGRVQMRIAGNSRMVPQKIMPDPEDEDRFVLAQRDPETGEPIPRMVRGRKSYVERDREGIWQVLKN